MSYSVHPCYVLWINNLMVEFPGAVLANDRSVSSDLDRRNSFRFQLLLKLCCSKFVFKLYSRRLLI
jgi:hypothetical protein